MPILPSTTRANSIKEFHRKRKGSDLEWFFKNLNFDGPLPERRPELGNCWTWNLATSTAGYGTIITLDDGPQLIHRFAYEQIIGPIPPGHVLDHLCRTTGCGRYDHLEPVTPSTNSSRGDAGKITGSRNRAKTHCKKGHPYDKENTYFAPTARRLCKICQRAHALRYYYEKVRPVKYPELY